jgi:hypothetical protein
MYLKGVPQKCISNTTIVLFTIIPLAIVSLITPNVPRNEHHHNTDHAHSRDNAFCSDLGIYNARMHTSYYRPCRAAI